MKSLNDLRPAEGDVDIESLPLSGSPLLNTSVIILRVEGAKCARGARVVGVVPANIIVFHLLMNIKKEVFSSTIYTVIVGTFGYGTRLYKQHENYGITCGLKC